MGGSTGDRLWVQRGNFSTLKGWCEKEVPWFVPSRERKQPLVVGDNSWDRLMVTMHGINSSAIAEES
jgi:hypothetical protein